MAVINTFGDDYLGQSTSASIDISPSAPVVGLTLRVPCECVVPLVGVAVLVVTALLSVLFLSIHLARVFYYIQSGVGASVFPLDR
jgi:hypothetical protein